MNRPDHPGNPIPPNLRAMGWMLVASIAFAGLWIVVRLISTELHPFVIVAWSNAMGLFWLLPLFLGTEGLLDPARMGSQARCAGWMLVAILATYYAVANAPFVPVLAISYAAPLLAALAGILVWREKARSSQIIALLVGAIGLFAILAGGEVNTGLWAAILAAVAIAGGRLAARHTAQDSPRATALWSFLLMAPMSLVIALPFWEWPRAHIWSLLFGMGACAAAAHLALLRAHALAGPATTRPFGYLSLALVTLAGTALFGEHYDQLSMIGAVAIIFAGIMLARPAPAPGRQ